MSAAASMTELTADAIAHVLAPGAPRVGFVHVVNGTHVGLWEEQVDEVAMRAVFRAVLARLRARDWRTERDPDVVKNYPSIADTHWVGAKGDLRFVASTGGRHLEFEFHQVATPPENKNGARYDFDKFRRMPRHLRLPCVVEMGAVVGKLLSWGYDFKRGDRNAPLLPQVLRMAEERLHEGDPLGKFNEGWTDRFERDETGWPAKSEYSHWGYHDRNGIELRTGGEWYFRDESSGRLLRGRVYPAINGNWKVVHGAGGGDCVASSRRLFLCERPDLEPRRLIAGQVARLERELDKALKTKRYDRVAALGIALERAVKRGAP